MKRLLPLLVLALLTVPLVAWTASDSKSPSATTQGFGTGRMAPSGDHNGDGIPNRLDPDFLATYHPRWTRQVSGAPSTSATFTCPNITHPRPQDGTGFGARLHARNTAGNGTGMGQGKGQGNGKGFGQSRGRGNCQRHRDGFCLNASSTTRVDN